MTEVDPAGPPEVMIHTCSKTWKLLINEIERTMKVVGVSSGSVSERNCSHLLAPSIEAAS